MEIAASYPDRIDNLILSAPAFVDDEHRELYGEKPPVDDVSYRLDGTHLVELWTMRAPVLPEGRRPAQPLHHRRDEGR